MTTDFATFTSSITLTPVNGTVAPTYVVVYIASTASAGSITGNLSISSAGATTVTVPLTGTVTATGTPTINLYQSSIYLGTATSGLAGGAYPFHVNSGTNLTANVTVTAPAGVQVSTNGTTWNSSLTLTESSGSLAFTTVYARMASTASAGSISANIAVSSTGAATQDIAVTGTVDAVGTPTISINPTTLNLGYGQAYNSSPGSVVTYTVAGSNLTANIVITSPSPYVQISSNGGSTWASTLTLTETSGSVASTTISVRATANLPPGTVGGNITNVSTGAAEQDVNAVASSYWNNAPTISAVSPISGPSAGGTVVLISGQGFTGATAVKFNSTAATSFTILSDTSIMAVSPAQPSGSTWSIGVTTPNGTSSQSGSTAYTYNTNPPAFLYVSTGYLDLGTTTTASIGLTYTFTVSGTNLPGGITLSGPAGVDFSGYQTQTLSPVNGTLAPTTVSVRIYGSEAGAGTWGGYLKFNNQNVISVVGNVLPYTPTPSPSPGTVTASPASLALGTVTEGTAGTTQSFTVSGSSLNANLVVTPPAGVEVSDDGGTTWHTSLTYVPVSGTVSTKSLLARIMTTAAVGSITGNIAVTSNYSSEQDVSVTGLVNSPVPLVFPNASSLALGTSTQGTAGTSQSFAVSGSGLTANLVVTAPTGVEVSTDGTTWSSSVSLSPTSGTVASTTVYARIKSTASAGPITGTIALTSTGATTRDVALTGSVVGVPTVTVSPSTLPLGTVVTGTAGTSQSFTVGGTSLTTDITVTAPTGTEVSTDGTTWSTSVTLQETSGTVASTTVYARIKSSASLGSVTGNIALTSTGATTQDVSVTGTVVAVPTMTVSPSSLALGTVIAGTAGTAQSLTVSGSNLLSNLVVTAPAGVEVSTDGTTWSASVSLPPTSGTVASTTVYARIKSTASVGSITTSIAVTSTSATEHDVTLTGTVNPAPTVTVTPSSLALGTVITGTAGTAQSFTVSGTNLTTGITVTPPAGVEVSTDGTTWSASVILPETSGTVAATSVYARIKSSASVGSITTNIALTSTGATTQDVSLTGTVLAVPTATVSPSSLALGTVITGTAGTPQSFTVSGSNLLGNLVVTAPAGVEISDDSGATWHDSLSFTPSSGTVSAQSLTARIKTTASLGSITTSIAVTSTSATEQDVTLTGDVVPVPTSTVSPTSLALGTVITGTAGPAQSFTVSGSNLLGDLVVTAPSGVEISDDGGTTWHTSLSYTPDTGTVSTKSLTARIASAATVGSITGDIAITSTSATEEDVSLTGTVLAVPTSSVSPSSLALGTVITGTAGTPQSFTASGSNLLGNLVVTAPAGVEISDDSGATWHDSLSFTPSSGTVSAQSLTARIKTTASLGSITTSIAVTSTSATEQDVTLTGDVIPVPTSTVSPSTLALGTVITGTAGTSQSFTVSGSNLLGDLVVTAPTGVEVSTDGTTWSASVTLPETSGSVASTTVYARIKSTASLGPITSDIAVTSTSATEEDVTLTGTVVPVPTSTVSPSSLGLGTVAQGTSGTAHSLTVSGSDLLGDLLVTAPASVEVSTDGTNWSASVSLSPTSGTVASTTVYIRIASTASVGSITGDIAITSTGAAEQDVSLTGTVENAMTLSPGDLPSATAGTPYSQQITASGGSGSGYTFSATDLPPGLSLSPLGLLSGTPTSASGSPYSFIIYVTDGDNVTQLFNYSLAVQRTSSESGAIIASSPEVFYGQTVTLTATFSATAVGSSPMTGTVAFYEGNTYLGTAPILATDGALFVTPTLPVASGQAILQTSTLSVGSHVITAIYSGDANYSSATTETSVTVEVVQATTSTSLAAKTDGQGTTLVATVAATSPGNPSLSGTVSFYEGTTLLGTSPVVNGVATLPIGAMSPGQHAFTAVFSGGGTSSTSTATVTVATGSPQIVGMSRYGFHDRTTVLVLYFNQALDPARAQDLSNYVITDSGGRRITVAKARYNAANNTVTLIPSTLLNIHWTYKLKVNGTGSTGLTGASGIALDGAETGVGGSDFRTRITWNALTLPGDSPAITFADGQAHGYTGKFYQYVEAVVRATEAAAHSIKLAFKGGLTNFPEHPVRRAKPNETKSRKH